MRITLPCLLKSVFRSAARVDADKPLTHRFLLAELLLFDLCSPANEIHVHTTYITENNHHHLTNIFERHKLNTTAIRLVKRICLNSMLNCPQIC